MTLGLLPLYVLLVLAGTALEPRSARRLAFLGLVSFALGLAAYAVSPGSDDLGTIAAAAAASKDAFFVVNTALLLLGVALSLAAALIAIYRGPPISPGRALALLCLGAFGTWTLAPLTDKSGGWRPVLCAAVLVAAGLVTGAVARRKIRIALPGRSVRFGHSRRRHRPACRTGLCRTVARGRS
jgi:hypothetical protein